MGQATGGRTSAAAIATGRPASSSSEAAAGVPIGEASLDVVVVGTPACSGGGAATGSASVAALFAGGSATSGSTTLAGAWTATAVWVGVAAAAAVQACSRLAYEDTVGPIPATAAADRWSVAPTDQWAANTRDLYAVRGG